MSPETTASLIHSGERRSTHLCPSCESTDGMRVIYEQRMIPTHSCALMETREAALAHPRGDMLLGFCGSCGFASNLAFDPNLVRYNQAYEETQGYSPTFSKFAQELAATWINRYDLRGKDVVEIGCGKGEFLKLLCDLGDNRGVGYDPAYVPGRTLIEPARGAGHARFVPEYFSERHSDVPADFICCRHTLEHIPATHDFVTMLRRIVGDRSETIVAFEVPDFLRILRDLAFWDIYYEHCSYFTLGSLGGLFRRSGFQPLDLKTVYDDQYLVIDAKPTRSAAIPAPAAADEADVEVVPVDIVKDAVESFVTGTRARLDVWRERMRRWHETGKRVVLWGSGSKAVGFLTALEITDEVECVVDINPHKHGKFMPGCCQEIVPPDRLRDLRPDVVIAMNSIYVDEIRRDLLGMGVAAEMLGL